MYDVLDVSTSALVAQRTRLAVAASNLANANTLTNADGEYAPYRRRAALLSPGDGTGGPGVHVAEIELDDAPFQRRWEPGSKFADADGYVSYPNVNPVLEQVNAMEASRAYEANITMIEATKSMINIALQIIA